MLVLDAEQVRRALDWRPTIEALRGMFKRGCKVPLRHHHSIAAPGGDATLLLMPAWTEDVLGVKIVSVFPANAKLGLPAVCGSYVLNDGRTGEPLAVWTAVSSRRGARPPHRRWQLNSWRGRTRRAC